MATPKYDALVAKVRSWSNKPETQTIDDSVIGDCLSYGADFCYSKLRIPALEKSVTYTIADADNAGEASYGLPYGNAYTVIDLPEDLIEFIYIRTIASVDGNSTYSTYPSNASVVFNEVTDARTFLDIYSEKYSRYNFMWKEGKIFIHPQIKVGQQLEIHYYRRLPKLNAQYSVIAENWVSGLSDAQQPYLDIGTPFDSQLFYSTKDGITKCFNNNSEASAYATPTSIKYWVGKESPNWLRDQKERLLIGGALWYIGKFLFDANMEARWEKHTVDLINESNTEERFRRAKGGNVQVNINTGGLI